MKVAVERTNVNTGARVTVFARFGDGWRAETMSDRNVGNPRCYRDSEEEFVGRFTAGTKTLQTLCLALEAGKVKREDVLAAGGSYGGKETILIPD